MVVLNAPIPFSEIDTKFVMGMMYQTRDKYRCSCSC